MYVRVSEEGALPNMEALGIHKTIVIIDETLPETRQEQISDWIVRSGCRYMMAWGEDCSSWDDSVDRANIRQFAPEEIPDEAFVITTWHERETLDEVFWFSKNAAVHPVHEMADIVLLHLSHVDKPELQDRWEGI